MPSLGGLEPLSQNHGPGRFSNTVYELEAFPQPSAYPRFDGDKQDIKDEKRKPASESRSSGSQNSGSLTSLHIHLSIESHDSASQSKKIEKPAKAYPSSAAESSSSSPWGHSTTWGGSTLQDTISPRVGTTYIPGASMMPTAYYGSAPTPLSRSEFVDSQAPDDTVSPVVRAPLRPLLPPVLPYMRYDPYTTPGIPILGASLLSSSHAVPDPNATLSSDLTEYLENQPVAYESAGYRKNN